MVHKWKIGDWAEIDGSRYFVFRVEDEGTNYVNFVSKHGNTLQYLKTSNVKHLPHCTDWDWKPIDPPDGMRLLVEGDVIVVTDWHYDCLHGLWLGELSERDIVVGCKYSKSAHTPMARKIAPKYRPFIGGEEYRPFFDKNFVIKGDTWRASGFSNVGVFYGARASYTSYETLFDIAMFADDTPFGQEVSDGT